MEEIILQLGTNKGNRSKNLTEAFFHIEKYSKIEHTSAIYETEAWGYKSQPNFYNQLIMISTEINPYALLKINKNIEISMGRTKEIHWGPRIIDIDIIIYGNKIIFSPDLIIPHEHMHERRFILEPLMEFENWVHPVFHKSTKQMLLECNDKSEIIRT